MLRLALALFLCAIVAGCSTVRPWINTPLQVGGPVFDEATIAARDSSALVAVTLSGGGARAAAFGLGVLQELRATGCCWNDRSSNLLSAVDLISGVSGGSIVAAYYAAFGEARLDDFEREFLRGDFQVSLWRQMAQPGVLYDLTSPWFGRSQLLEQQLQALYRGTTFGDIARRPRHPELVITATDLSLGTGFQFTTEQFDLICSDLHLVPLSFAVTASSAVPLVLSPMTLRNYGGSCPATALDKAPAANDYRSRLLRAQTRSYLDANERPYLHLVDGGLADNLGLRGLLERALTYGSLGATFSEVAIKPGSIKRLVLIVVNAERDPSVRIDHSDLVPTTADVIDALLFGTGNHASQETEGYLSDVTRRWAEDLRDGRRDRFPGFASDAEIFLVHANLRDAPENAQRHQLLQVPTAFSISDDEVTHLIAAGRVILRASPQFQALRKSLGLSPEP